MIFKAFDTVSETLSHLQFKSWKFHIHPSLYWKIQTVTNITFTGSAMVNWNRGLLIQGMTTVIVVNVHALGHFVGWSASIKGSGSPSHHKQTRLDWQVDILVYWDEGRHWYGWVPGSATNRHSTTGTWWNSSSLAHNMDTCLTSYKQTWV